ncbi:MAG TPA: molybdenum cofactor biosynthesis protein MoaE [Eoetvoesiella sp.]
MVIVQNKDFNAADLAAQLRERTAGKAGAMVTFTGYVRDYSENMATHTLFLEHYPGMCEREIQTICDTAQSRWNTFEPVVVHRVGELQHKEQIVFIAVASAHRGDAFKACEYIIDALKTRAPFWKRETLASGERFWVQQHNTDSDKTAQWENPEGQLT